MKQERRTPQYTTRWEDVPIVSVIPVVYVQMAAEQIPNA
ncbi:DUF4113 domain-containing protein [Ottowia sp. GY511]|uniref:DUF4113 domain-containing protein n=1 Tax=Ottowia flava TaxID=2675430 RepID=A0ABW4KQJ4_9BURK|nr:DUF4113 domain-containing protein [Ottowia sp. GY511]